MKMKGSIFVYILVMAGVSFVIRVLPMTLIKKPIENRFLKSFLYYVPYVTLAVMTFPAIIESTGSVLTGSAALAVGIILPLLGVKLLPVAVSCCAVVLLLEYLM